MMWTPLLAQGLLILATFLASISGAKHSESHNGLLVDSDLDYRTGPNPPPVASDLSDRAFTAVWNVKHSSMCQTQFGVNLHLDAYGILADPPASLTRDVMAFFGHQDFGIYPYIRKRKVVNGGLPQLVNMTAHLEKAANDVVTIIPDANFSGLAVIDWEYWSPAWERSAKVYQTESMAMVHRRHPEWSSAMVKAVAKVEFEQAARTLYEGSLKLARALRPRGLWGFYHFPYCNNKQDVKRCIRSVEPNNQLLWLADASGALYPSIYIKIKTFSKNATVEFVNTILDEAFRVREKSRNPTIPMYSYCAMNYSYTAFELNLEDLNNTVLLSAERGLSGVVLWSDNNQTSNRAACLDLQKYIKSALGPLVLQITKAASWCAKSLCNSHGRCVGRILECMQQDRHAVMTPSKGTSGKNTGVKKSVCQCQCYAGWKGTNCKIAL